MWFRGVRSSWLTVARNASVAFAAETLVELALLGLVAAVDDDLVQLKWIWFLRRCWKLRWVLAFGHWSMELVGRPAVEVMARSGDRAITVVGESVA